MLINIVEVVGAISLTTFDLHPYYTKLMICSRSKTQNLHNIFPTLLIHSIEPREAFLSSGPLMWHTLRHLSEEDG